MNPYDPNNNPTLANSAYIGPNPSIQNSYPSMPPPRQPIRPPQRGIDSWFNRQSRRNKVAFIGCASLVGVLFLCTLCSLIGNALPTPKNQATSVTESTPTQVVESTHQEPTLIPTGKPTPTPTATPQPTPTPVRVVAQPTSAPAAPVCNGTLINGGCYNYDSSGGTLVYSPPASFCSYFTCVSTFWTATSGYVAKCADGKHTHSGGVSGACSKNGGIVAPVYQH